MAAAHDIRNVLFEAIPYVDSRRVGWTLYRGAVGRVPESPNVRPGNHIAISSIDFIPPGGISRDSGLVKP